MATDDQSMAPEPRWRQRTDTYGLLARPFETFQREDRPGVGQIDYLTGEQVMARLDDVLGPGYWQFQSVREWIDENSDECMVLGQLDAWIPDGEGDYRHVSMQQYGGQKIKYPRGSTPGDPKRRPIEMNFDWKGAATDALKKCATLLSVGRYLYIKWDEKTQEDPAAALVCEICGGNLAEVRFRNGSKWSPTRLATLGRRNYLQVLCWPHHKEAMQAMAATRRAQAELPAPTGEAANG